MADPIALASDILSITLLLPTLLILLYLTIRARTLGSFQFQTLLFVIVFSASEIPKFLEGMGVIDLGSIRPFGLVFHTISMVYLAGFVAYRTYRFLKG